MKNVKFIELENPEGTTTEHAIIDRGNNEYTSMPKSVYDEMIAAQSTPIDTEDE
jgi:predicted aspartyl protease